MRDQDGNIVARKSLFFQAKNRLRGRSQKLADQARQVATLPGGGCVVNYSREGYVAADANVVADREGAWPPGPESARSFGDYLADEFLPCTVGSRDVYYDASRQQIVYLEVGRLRVLSFTVRRRTRTTVVKG